MSAGSHVATVKRQDLASCLFIALSIPGEMFERLRLGASRTHYVVGDSCLNPASFNFYVY